MFKWARITRRPRPGSFFYCRHHNDDPPCRARTLFIYCGHNFVQNSSFTKIIRLSYAPFTKLNIGQKDVFLSFNLLRNRGRGGNDQVSLFFLPHPSEEDDRMGWMDR